MASLPLAGRSSRRSAADPARAWAAIAMAVFLVIAVATMVIYPFPSPIDELQHYSVIRAQFEHPDLFADPRGYRIVDPAQPALWLGTGNYLNHPALYYLALSPLLGLGDGILALRIANILIALAALALTIVAGWRILPRQSERIAFAIIAACFPKGMLLAGMINNDNLAMLAAAIVFAGLSAPRHRPILLAFGLALAGWTKLTALISLAALVGVWLLLDRKSLFTRDGWSAAAGVALGSTPFLAMKLKTGMLVPVNIAAFGRAPELRPNWGMFDFTRNFLGNLAMKWPAGEDTLPLALAAALAMFPLILAVIGATAPSPARRLITATLAATAITFAIHIGFGWQSFQMIGDVTIAQTRYYNTLWPGLALGGAVAIGQWRRLVPASVLLVPYLAPTMLGVTVMMLAERLYG